MRACRIKFGEQIVDSVPWSHEGSGASCASRAPQERRGTSSSEAFRGSSSGLITEILADVFGLRTGAFAKSRRIHWTKRLPGRQQRADQA